jgi:hypothetical protein
MPYLSLVQVFFCEISWYWVLFNQPTTVAEAQTLLTYFAKLSGGVVRRSRAESPKVAGYMSMSEY